MAMGRGDLTNEEWARLKPHLPMTGQRGGRWENHRRVINGILFRLRTGAPWQDLPEHFGPWKTVFERHRRWSADGTWDRIFAAVLVDADAEGRIDWSMASVDSTSCRAHQHAAGACKRPPRVPGKRRTPRQHRPDEGLGRSRGGLTCKIHLGGDKAYSSRRNRRYLWRRPRWQAHGPQQSDLQPQKRSREDDQRLEELPGGGHEVRQARLRLPRIRHGGRDTPLDPH